MQNARIFIVEDEESLANTLALNLKLENYDTTVARSGKEAEQLFATLAPGPDLVLLDVMLPDINGFDLCKQFRQHVPGLPVVFLTAKNQTADKIEGLRLGADDYITKPFDLEELLLRINNLIRRARKDNPETFRFDGGSINFTTYEINDLHGNQHTLSRREIGLLELLTSQANKVISRDEIIEKLWGDSDNASSRTIDNYILNFRKYFEHNPKSPKHFHSVRGVGYKFIA